MADKTFALKSASMNTLDPKVFNAAVVPAIMSRPRGGLNTKVTS